MILFSSHSVCLRPETVIRQYGTWTEQVAEDQLVARAVAAISPTHEDITARGCHCNVYHLALAPVKYSVCYERILLLVLLY